MAALQTEYQENFEVNQVKDSMLTPLAKKSRIQEVKKSFANKKKNSSIKTMFSIANTMVGSAIVVFPIVFHSSGLITSLIVMTLVGVLSCKTCLLELIHFNPTEIDFPDAIRRILGKKWYIAYSVCSFVLLFVTGIIYFILICNMIYPFLSFILDSCGTEIAKIDKIVFDNFSYQYTGLIMIIICFFFFQMKDLGVLLKLGQYGIISIVIFIGYIIVRGCINIEEGNVNLDNVEIFTTEFANLCGVFALSFFIHNIIIPIMKNNKDEKKNSRDVILGYIMTGCVYAIIGVFGTFAIAGVKLADGKKANTVLDYFNPNVGTAIVEVLLFLQLLSVEPIIWYVARSQFFNLIYKNDPIPNRYFILSNIVFSLSCLVIQIINVDPTLIISLNGAICGFLLVYIIPIKLHLKCLYSDPNEIKKSLLHDEDELSGITTTEDGARIANLNMDKLEVGGSKGQINYPNETHTPYGCNSMHEHRRQGISKNMRYLGYFIIICFGLAFAIIKIVNLAMGK